jgi:hypothetical protein
MIFEINEQAKRHIRERRAQKESRGGYRIGEVEQFSAYNVLLEFYGDGLRQGVKLERQALCSLVPDLSPLSVPLLDERLYHLVD